MGERKKVVDFAFKNRVRQAHFIKELRLYGPKFDDFVKTGEFYCMSNACLKFKSTRFAALLVCAKNLLKFVSIWWTNRNQLGHFLFLTRPKMYETDLTDSQGQVIQALFLPPAAQVSVAFDSRCLAVADQKRLPMASTSPRVSFRCCLPLLFTTLAGQGALGRPQ